MVFPLMYSNAIVTNKLIETGLKNGQSGSLSADRLQFCGFHCCCCCSFTGVLQFASQEVPKKKPSRHIEKHIEYRVSFK